MRRQGGRHYGFSLFEILIAGFLLVILGAITWGILKSTMNASAHGHFQIKLQENARNVLSTISGEMRQACRPPRIGTSPQYSSGVLMPFKTSYNIYGTDNENTYSASDTGRIIFLEMTGMGSTSSENYQTNITNYRIIEYRVIKSTASEGAKIIRYVWAASDTTNLSTGVLGLTYNGTDFLFDSSSFGSSGSLSSTSVIELPYPTDTLSLYASHPPVQGSTTLYDDRIFNLKLTVSQALRRDEKRRSTFTVETSVYVR